MIVMRKGGTVDANMHSSSASRQLRFRPHLQSVQCRNRSELLTCSSDIGRMLRPHKANARDTSQYILALPYWHVLPLAEMFSGAKNRTIWALAQKCHFTVSLLTEIAIYITDGSRLADFPACRRVGLCQIPEATFLGKLMDLNSDSGLARIAACSPIICSTFFVRPLLMSLCAIPMRIPILPANGSKRRAAAALISTSLLLAGCNLGPNYKRPEMASPPAWQTQAADAAIAANWPSAEWWHAFNSPELDAYIAEARRANNDLAAALARVRQADALAAEAGAALLPTVGAQFNSVKEREQSTSSTYSTYRANSPQLTASYMLDFWGKNRATQEAALATATASRYNRTTVELTVVTSVALTYFQSMALRERVAVAEGNLASAQVTLKGLHRQLDAGIATALDVAQQETTVATLAAAVPPLRQQYRQSLDALAILIGRNPEAMSADQATLANLALPAVTPGLPSELLARRPDVADAESQLIAANANIKVARAAFFPSIQLTASAGYSSSALTNLVRSSNSVYSVGAGIAQPLFDGGLLQGQYDYAKARYDELAADYRKAVLTAFGNVEDSLVSVQQSAEQAQRLQIAVDKAQRAHRIAQAQLHSGVVNILTVLNTETALFTAQDALIQAKYSQVQALVGLFGALGGGWQKEETAHEG